MWEGSERISADKIAGWCGTISYEVFCSIGRNHDRIFMNGSGGCWEAEPTIKWPAQPDGEGGKEHPPGDR